MKSNLLVWMNGLLHSFAMDYKCMYIIDLYFIEKYNLVSDEYYDFLHSHYGITTAYIQIYIFAKRYPPL